MRFSTLLSKFREVAVQHDGGYLARCPGHDDSDPSLRIWLGDNGKVRMTCRAGCDTEAVIAAVGLKFTDLFNVEGDGLTVPAVKPQMAGQEEIDDLAAYVRKTSAELQSSDSGMAYLAGRFGIDVDAGADLGIGFDDGTVQGFKYRSRGFTRYPRLTVPLFDFDGVPHGLQGRDISGQCPSRWVSLSNPEGHRWGKFGVFRGGGGYRTFVVTEGPGDALTAWALGYDAVFARGAALGGSTEVIGELARGMRDADRIVIAGDADRAGQGFVKALSDGLHKHGLTPYTLVMPDGVKDITAWRETVGATAFPGEFHAAIGAATPYGTDQQRTRDEVDRRTGADMVSPEQGLYAATVLAQLVTQYGESDAMNAYALMAWADGSIRYAHGLGFYVWNGKVWQHSETKVRQQVHKMGAALVLAGKLHESKGFTMTTRIDALLTELRSVPSCLVDVNDFDAHPHLLNFSNGTVDLRTGALRPHSKDDLLTSILDFDYVPDAKCPRWDSFLTEIFPTQPELVGYTQRLVGYGITGSTSEQCFTVLYGSGANGKSVFTDTLSSVFGPITRTTRFSTFEQRATGAIPNDIAILRGSRLVMSSEGGANKTMDEEGLKNLTGKDKVQARFLHKEFFEYKPTFLIMLATNHKPNFRSQDEGLWRRVKMIPFLRYFAPHERDYELDRKLVREREGIAAWAVRGAVEWYKSGLNDPGCIRHATQEFRETSDTLSGFYPGVIEQADGQRISGAQAYIEYTSWCEEEGLRGGEVMRRTSFYRAMEERGVTKRKMAEGIVLEGVRLAKAPMSFEPGGIK
jgi:putative DNA primase/helicase